MIYDLHVHSTSSDGKKTRLELVRDANYKGLKVLSFTDHSFIDDVTEEELNQQYEQTYHDKSKVILLNGIELDIGDHGSMHMLGYNLKDKTLIKQELEKLKYKNNEVCEQILRNIKKYHNLVITKEDLFPYMKDEFITKRIIIEYLIQKGIVKNNDEASLKYTGRQAKSYEKRAEFTSEEAIDLIKKSGGIPVLAHPTTLHMTNGELDDEISRLKDLGLVGMEVNNTSKTSISQLNIYRMLADKYELVKTSGTDFHRVDRNPFCIGVNNSDSDSFFNLPEIKEVIEKGRR